MADSRSERRNIGILAHIDAGKTSLTERLLYVAGRIRAPGAVDSGTTATDYLEVERERGITVKAAAARLSWNRCGAPGVDAKGIGSAAEYRIDLIDTPGHVDFGSEVERSLRALDGAVVLLCAVAGVQSRTETLYRACLRRGAPRIVFVNKMDRRGASFERALCDLQRSLDPRAVAVQIPWGEGESFRGVVDLVEMRAYDFEASAEESSPAAAPAPPECVEASARPVPAPLPDSLREAALAARARLVESLAADDDGLMEDFAAGRESGSGKLRAALREATLACRVAPVLCGTAFRDAAAALLLDAVADYLPSPSEAGCPEAVDPASGAALRLEASPNASFSALVFKTGTDPSFGQVAWARVWSGSASPGDRLLDARSGVTLRLSRVFFIQANRLEATPRAEAGDIVGLALSPQRPGLTGATLCDPARPLLYEQIRFEDPVVSLAIEPRTKADLDALKAAVAALVAEDPSLRASEDPQTGRVELAGSGELHLEVAAERLAREYGARVRVGRPRVAFREALAGRASAREDFDRELGGERVRASVAIELGPGPRGSGFSFVVAPELRVSTVLALAARRGAEAALCVGPTAGFPLGDAELRVVEMVAPGKGGSGSPGKGPERAVEIAASIAAGRAAREAGSRVLEPVMRLEIETAEECLGQAVQALSARGGRVESVDAGSEGRVVSGTAPLRRLFGFAGELRSATGGRASYQTRFEGFEPVPKGFSDWNG